MITIIAGSKSDRELVKKVEKVLDEFEVGYKSRIASAHRTPKKLKEIIETSGSDVFIGVAGLSAALPGVIASYTIKPVIGLPRDVKLSGLDSFLSMVQMPPGVPVATVGVDNAKNAAFLALEILAVGDENLKNRLKEYRKL